MIQDANAHWIGLADVVSKDLKRRVEALAKAPRKRTSLVNMFYHKLTFDPRYVVNIGKKGTEKQVLALLNKWGCPDEVLELNAANGGEGEWKPMERAITDVYGSCYGELISCLPGKLFFYEAEEPEFRAVIYRAA